MDFEREIAWLMARIEQTNDYLVREAETVTDYGELIEDLKLVGDCLRTAKPVVTIVGSATLAENLQQKNLANPELRSLYKFNVVSLNKVQQVVRDSDLICLVYYFKQNILKQHQRLIELALQQDISLILVVRQPNKDSQDAMSSWLNRQCFWDEIQLPLANFIYFEKRQHFDRYQQLLCQRSTLARNRFLARNKQKIQTIVRDFFWSKIKIIRQEIQDIDRLDLPNQPPYYYRQLKQIGDRFNREKQQTVKIIKQKINCLKADLLNPFRVDLIFIVQQAVYYSQVKEVREAKNTYLYLTVDRSSDRYLHDYIFELCQQKIDEIIAFQWSQINYVYGDGGLQNLFHKVDYELTTISSLFDLQDDTTALVTVKHPSLDLATIIDFDCLKFNSRIVFDYNFTQSSWFRLLISLLVGVGIYLFTWMYLGSGKYLGFVIIIIQIINLITGNNNKKIKLKQHSKELKRIADRQYQTLVRLAVEGLVQTLITALEREIELSQARLDRAIATAETRLEQLQAIAQHRSRIDHLRRDRATILSWFEGES